MTDRVFALPAVLTHAQATATAQALVQSVQAQPGLVLDASALQQFDSSALAVLLAGMRQAAQQGGQLRVQGLPARAASLARVYGLTDLLDLPTATA
jgi:phospholipid transport system transporter-binding protein